MELFETLRRVGKEATLPANGNLTYGCAGVPRRKCMEKSDTSMKVEEICFAVVGHVAKRVKTLGVKLCR